ncbi:MAG: hypothetical protein E7113_00440 [Bacteroidales bacterium]|nr:hypothetical protein [Bacteroidales bacterium]
MTTIMVTTIITTIIMLIKRRLNIFAAASLLALSSCASLEENPSGLINMWFEVSGTVMDPAGFPIEGISVIAESAEPVQTDVSGRFTVQGGGVPAESASIRFLDAVEDDVKYLPKTVMVDLERYKDGEGWIEGYYRNKGEVVVTLSREDMIIPPTSDAATGQGEEQ